MSYSTKRWPQIEEKPDDSNGNGPDIEEKPDDSNGTGPETGQETAESFRQLLGEDDGEDVDADTFLGSLHWTCQIYHW